MLTFDNREIEPAAATNPADITIGELLGFLAAHKEKPVLFVYDGHTIRSGYHVTEVKAGQFASLDCGANAEAWPEIFVQLWDIHGDQGHMPAGKFSAIIGKVSGRVDLEPAAKLTFEVSDGIRPMQLYRAALPRVVEGVVQVELSARPASCKPRDRWLEDHRVKSACCAPSSAEKACCG